MTQITEKQVNNYLQTYTDSLDLIGKTPLVKLQRINENPQVSLWAKLENRNLTGSIKDRIALQMINEAEKTGRLTPEKIIIEPTSGNTGIGLATISAIKGFSFTAVMAENVSKERKNLIRILGGKIIFTPAKEGSDGAIRKVRELTRKFPHRYFFLNQYANPENPQTHYDYTAEEIWQQTQGKISMLVAGLGTSGTLMGLSRKLKELNAKIKIIATQPEKKHQIYGLKNLETAIVPKIFDEKLIDETIFVSDQNAYATTRQIIRKEGLLVGISSGAALWTALKKAQQIEKGMIVVIFPDHTDRYFSTKLFADETPEKRG